MNALEQSLFEGHAAKVEAADPGQAAIDMIDTETAVQEQADQTEAGKAAYAASPVSSSGPPMDTYDYDGAHAGGANFKPAGEGGGVNLPVKNFKPGQVPIGDYDQQGTRVRNRFADEEGHIKAGAEQLAGTSFDTVNGAPDEAMHPLSRVAFGMLKEGANYSDFEEGVSPLWSRKQKLNAWQTAHRAEERGWLEEGLSTDAFVDPGWPVEIPRADQVPPLYLKDLSGNVDWLAATEILYMSFHGEEWKGLVGAEGLSDWGVRTMSKYNNSLLRMAAYTGWAINSDNPELKKAVFNMIVLYDRVDNWDGHLIARAVDNTIGDPVSMMSGGASTFLIKKALLASRNILLRHLLSIGVTATEGGLMSLGMEASRQAIDMSSEGKSTLDFSNYDKEMLAYMTAGGAILGTALAAAPSAAGGLLKTVWGWWKKGEPGPKAGAAPMAVRMTPAERSYFEEMMHPDDIYDFRAEVPSARLTEDGLIVDPADYEALFNFIEQSITNRDYGERLPPGFYSSRTMKRVEGMEQ